MAGISSNSAGALVNKKKYNTWERNYDLELDVDESFYRVNDYQTGRFWQPDPKIEMGLECWSPYTSNLDNPLRFNDLLGDLPGDEYAPSRKSLFNPPSAETVNKYPAIALLQTVGYLGWNLFGGSAVEEFAHDRIDGKNSVADVTLGVVNVGFATTKGEGEGTNISPKKGGVVPTEMGASAETAVGTTKPKLAFDNPLNPNAKIKPDQVTPKTLKEVKNVAYQYFSTQLKAYKLLADATGRAFKLYLRSDTKVSKPLQKEFDNGTIKRKKIPGT